MRISRVHVDADLNIGETILLEKSRGHYLKNVLRLNSGAALLLFNGRETCDYEASLIVDGKQVSATIHSAKPTNRESGFESELLQGLGRADHIDWTLQKTTELGVTRISLFNAEHTQSPLKPALLEKKLGHWRNIVISACEQCGRSLPPQVDFHTNLEQAISAARTETGVVLDFDGAALTSALSSDCKSTSVLVGPEGGLSPAEISYAREAGFISANLGPRVLRTETAATAALAILQATLGDIS